MKKSTLLVTAFLIFFTGLVVAQQPAPVKVEQGIIQGAFEDGLSVYKGIPFAAPPVGDLRWRAPQPAAKWEGVKQTIHFAPGPMQGGNPPSGKSEDCLYLNVWSPAKSAKDKVPVLVWIYGGGFGAGATSEWPYSGEKLAKKGVVLVSIAYRVGQLGFFSHPELSAENPNHVSGNYGLLDMIAGLKWIKQNIAAFGGDPERVNPLVPAELVELTSLIGPEGYVRERLAAFRESGVTTLNVTPLAPTHEARVRLIEQVRALAD